MKQSSMTTVYPPSFLTLPVELKVEILSLVDQKTLLIFEEVSKSVAHGVYETWHIHKSLAGFKFSWSDCQKENCPEKWELILTRTLIRYIYSKISFYNIRGNYELYCKARLLKTNVNYFNLEEPMKRFPSFGTYMRLDLAENLYAHGYRQVYKSYSKFTQNEINKEQHDSLISEVEKICTLPHKFRSYVQTYFLARIKQRYKQRTIEKKSNTLWHILSDPQNLSGFNNISATLLNDLEQKNKICETPSNHGGELLLRALFKIKERKFKTKEKLNKINQYLLDAIKQQVTCASQLAFDLIYAHRYTFSTIDDDLDNEEIAQLYEPLAMASAEQGDLSCLVNLAFRKWHAGEWAKAESLYEDYLKDIANKPIHGLDLLKILYKLTDVKVELEKWKEVKLLFTEIKTLLLKLNQALTNRIDIASVRVIYEEMKDLSSEDIFKEFSTFLLDPQVKEKLEHIGKMIDFEYPNFLSNLSIAQAGSKKNGWMTL